MNQTQKRLKIINLAISITDIDTIQLQILKLNQIKTDEALQDIISTLQSNNYAKAQTLITQYLENPITEEVIQRVDNNITVEHNKESNLYNEYEEDAEPIELQLDDMLKIQNEYEFTKTQEPIDMNSEDINFDNLLNITHDDVMSENINIDLTTQEQGIDWNEKLEFVTDDIPKDDYFGEEKTLKTLDTNNLKDEQNEHNSTYPAIPYIEEMFQNIKRQYPQTMAKLSDYQSVNSWLDKIKNEGYTEDNIEEMIAYIYKISNKNSAEASQLLLLTACTKSKYANFILARELYRGKLLQKNIAESFDIMYDLAINQNYPEAICDLAQFYEYGIGVKKDTKEALRLYDESMQLGITRALRHYDRLSKEKKGLFSLFK